MGKSNLFDAIAFLAALADKPLMEAALAVRGGEARRGDLRSLFRKMGKDSSDLMRFQVEMIIPKQGQDELGQTAYASMTFLQYDLELRYRPDPTIKSMGALEVVRENMTHINRGDAKVRLGFPHKTAWRESVVWGRRTSPYISTEIENGTAIVALHADSEGGKGGGRPRRVPASSLPRTMLSSVNNAAEHRTLVLARQEMMSWTQLQLEPSALRAPDGFNAPRFIGANGAHLPATLYELAQRAERDGSGGRDNIYASVANRLSQLVENVRNLTVEVDEKRQLLNIVMTDRHSTEHVASALSDGTLRFLVLTVMEADPKSRSLLCLEEPENDMHPLRIPAVPVRMQEAWLLHDEAALRQAAGRPAGREPLGLPLPARAENLPDPKQTLCNALRTASGRKGRRAKQFNPAIAAHLRLIVSPSLWRIGRRCCNSRLSSALKPTRVPPCLLSTSVMCPW